MGTSQVTVMYEESIQKLKTSIFTLNGGEENTVAIRGCHSPCHIVDFRFFFFPEQ